MTDHEARPAAAPETAAPSGLADMAARGPWTFVSMKDYTAVRGVCSLCEKPNAEHTTFRSLGKEWVTLCFDCGRLLVMRGALGCRIRFRQQMDRVTQARRAKRSDTKLKKNELFEAFYGPMRREVDRFRADERLPVKHLTFWAALSRQLHEDHPPSRQQRILHARYARDALEALDLDVKSARVNLAGHALPVVRLPDFQGKPALRFTNNPPHVPVKKER